jgi:hypothetical protein
MGKRGDASTTLEVGKTYFFQTCTKDWVGRLHSVDGPYTVTLTGASWVADSGRLSVFVREGRAEGMEVEPVGVVCCQWVNWIPWPHKLFTEAV